MSAKIADAESSAARYPYYPLANALKIAEAVKDLGGARASVKKSLLAKQLGSSENSAVFAQQLASARAFGVIEGRGDSSLTELSKRYFFPTSESDKSIALLEMFATPTTFSELLMRFDGDKLPQKDILGNILHRDLAVPESWKDRAASLFSNSAQTVGVIDAQGFIRFDAAKHSGSAVPAKDQAPAPLIPQTRSLVDLTDEFPTKDGRVRWRYKSIEVVTPENMDRALWGKLVGYVNLLEPVD